MTENKQPPLFHAIRFGMILLMLIAMLAAFPARGVLAAPGEIPRSQASPIPTVTTITGVDDSPATDGFKYYVRFQVARNAANPSGYQVYGTITVTDGAGASCSRTVNTGTVYTDGWAWGCTITSLTGGNKTFSATFVPANPAQFSGSSDTFSLVVIPTVTTITGIDNLPSYVGTGYYVRFQVARDAANPSGYQVYGTITVTDGTGASCSRTVDSGTVYSDGWAWGCTLTSTTAGSKTLTATFVPLNYIEFGSSSGTYAHTVSPAITTTTLVASPVSPTYTGDLVTFTATVTPLPTGGTVTFTDNLVAMAGCSGLPLDGSGQASCATSALAYGTHTIRAAYSGTSNYFTSMGMISHTVYDITPPAPVITSTVASPTNASSIPVTITFSEPVTGFTISDIYVTNGTRGNFTGSGAIYTADVTPVAEGTVTVNVYASAASDLAGNLSLAAAPFSFTFDMTPPFLTSIARQDPSASPTNANMLIFRATFNEDVQYVNAADFAVNGTTTAAVSGAAAVSPGTYDLTVSGGDLAAFNGVVGLDLSAGQNISDAAGNALQAGEPGTDETYLLDNNGPTVAITSGVSDPTSASSFTVTVNFSEPINGFDIGDIAVGNGSKSNFSGSGTTYTVDITPGTDGLVTVDVPNGAATDGVGNANETAPQFSVTYDGTPPSFTSIILWNPSTSPTNADTLVFRVAFNEDVQNVSTADFAVNGTSTAAVSGMTVVDAKTYQVSVSGGDLSTFNGTLGIDLSAGQNISDIAGNALPGGEPGTDETYLLDNTSSAVTSITRQTPPGSPTNDVTVIFRVTFNESVSNVDATDFGVSLTGTATGIMAALTPVSASVYDATINTVGGDGILGLVIAPANDIQDLPGNALGASPSINVNETYVIDNSAIEIILKGGVIGQPGAQEIILGETYTSHFVSLLITFDSDASDPAGDADPDDVTNPDNYQLISTGPDGIFTSSACGSISSEDVIIPTGPISYNNSTFEAAVMVNNGTPLPSGLYRLYICGSTSITDLAGNPLSAGEDVSLDFSIRDPLVAANVPATGFAPDRVTILPEQTSSYTNLGDFWLEIPSLGVRESIVGVPLVDDAWDVSWLGSDIGWLNGSAFPTWAGNSVLTAHVYDAFGRPGPFAGINRLWYGSQIIVHAWGGEYVYEVRSVIQINPNNTAAMLKHQTLPWLTLVTCRGYDAMSETYKYRVLVRAVLVDVK